MPTGDERVNLALKRFLSQNRMDANFLEYLDGVLTDGLSRIFPASGLFTYPVNFSFPSAGHFSLTPDPIEGIDDQGHVLIAEGSDRLTNISFEDDGSSTYWVGMKYIQVPSGVYANPRTGVPEYDKWADEIGEVDYATSVTDLGGGQIELELDFIFPDGADHSGRVVRAYLENPLSSDPAVAFEDLTVSFSGGHNIIQTAGSFGQGSVSLNPTTYRVALLGVSVYESGPNPFGTEYCILGEIDSSGGPSADTGDQLDLSGGGGHTLQKAYDGLGGLGSGRTIVANNEAVLLVQENDTLLEKDIYQAALRIDKATDKGPLVTGSVDPKDIEVALDLKGRMRSGGLCATRVNLYDLSGSDFIRAEEADVEVTVAGDILTFNRVGVDLQNTGNDGKLLQGVDLCEISGSTQGNDGLYYVNALATGSCTLYGLDYVAAALAQEVGNANLRASFWRPTARIGSVYQETHSFIGLREWFRDGTQSNVPIRVVVAPTCNASDPVQRWEVLGGDYLEVQKDMSIVRNGVNPVTLSPAATSARFEVNGAGDFEHTANGDIKHSGSGDIVHTSTGDIVHQGAGHIRHEGSGDFQCDTGRNFAFDPVRQIWRPIPIERMISRFNDPTNVPDWDISRFSGDKVYAFCINATGEMYLPFEIPAGCELTDVQAIVQDTATGTISMVVFDASFNWSTGAVGSVGTMGSVSSDNSGSEQLIEVTGLSESGGTSGTTYRIVFLSDEASANIRVYAARLIMNMSYVQH